MYRTYIPAVPNESNYFITVGANKTRTEYYRCDRDNGNKHHTMEDKDDTTAK